MEILNTNKSDLATIYELFEDSIRYQEKIGVPVWKNYDRDAIIRDIEDKNQFKIVVDNAIAIVYSIRYSDKIIWRHLDDGKAIYLHRIVVNPNFKGQRLFGKVVDRAIQYAKEKEFSAVRMDTWANNPAIIDYYKSFGFSFVENYTTPDSEQLPVHNRNLALTLLELQI
jgi:ribosomal protein S18 acetylase RimI-like enzyme